VVIFGVLVALALDNLVQEVRWRNEAQELERLFADDLQRNLAMAVERRASDPCLADRLSQLADRVSAAHGALNADREPLPPGDPTRVAVPYRAPLRPYRMTSFERALGTEALKRVPHDRFISYGVLFDWADRINNLQVEEAVAIASLAPLANYQPRFEGEVRAQALSDLALADSYRWRIAAATTQLVAEAKRSSLAPDRQVVEATQVGAQSTDTLNRVLLRARERRGACMDEEGALRLLGPRPT
jgi:hypothetical protein